nr:MAG TPA: tail tape measure protein [Caudoviricetes sp.]
MSDGKVAIDTELKQDGLSKGMRELQAKFEKGAKVMAGAAIAAGAAVVSLTQKSVQAYARYEQLVGGVETLYGAGGKTLEEYAKSVGKSTNSVKGEYNKLMGAQKTVLDNAANAYKNAGMSANQYMDTVTSFAAALTSSVGGDTQKAAEKANMAINDMADNANKMGTNMQMIQNAYNGFAKQNYTMLDNLKLGYGGTKSEMERLLKDAEKISGIHYDISSYADIVDAIHVIQKEMGVTGTTAEEAEHTIEGSLNMTKAAWENLVVGIADDNADFDTLMQNFIDSVSALGKNMLPRIKIVIEGIGKLVTQLAPVIAKQLPGLLASILPDMLTAISSTVIAIAQALVESAPTIIEALLKSFLQIGEALEGLIQELIPKLVEVILQIVELMVNARPQILQTWLDLFLALATAILQALPIIINHLPIIIQGIVAYFVSKKPMILSTAVRLFFQIVKAIPIVLVSIIKAIPRIILAIVKGLLQGTARVFLVGVKILKAFWNGIRSWAGALGSRVARLARSLPGKLKSGLSSLVSIGKNWIEGLWNGIGSKATWLCNKIKQLASDAKQAIKDFFHIKSPSRVMRDEVGRFITLGIGQGIEMETKNLIRTARAQMARLLGAYEIGALNTELKGSTGITDSLITNNSMIGGRLLAGATNSTIVNQEINFNVENTSPIQTARMLKDQALYGLAGAR